MSRMMFIYNRFENIRALELQDCTQQFDAQHTWEIQEITNIYKISSICTDELWVHVHYTTVNNRKQQCRVESYEGEVRFIDREEFNL